ncbi:MAG: NUDIX domain-containing protein [Candidatus Shapirobacteria bacterium]
MEKFDLVDLQDNIIGETDKLTSHQNGDLHRVVAIFVFNQKGELYLQEHIKSGGLFDHSVGGHVTKGENYDDAAKREGFEELSLNCPLNKVSIFYSDETYTGKQIRHIFAIYECIPTKDWEFIANDEVKTIIPMKIKDIINLMNTEPTKFTPGFLNTMREYISQKQLPFILKDYTKEHLNYPILK